ncbi:hypothetical protein FKM82_025355 [Ascaphus truei]
MGLSSCPWIPPDVVLRFCTVYTLLCVISLFHSRCQQLLSISSIYCAHIPCSLLIPNGTDLNPTFKCECPPYSISSMLLFLALKGLIGHT